MRRFLLLPLLLTFNFLLFTPAYAAGATLSLSPTSGTFNRGCTFTLDITLDTGGAQTDGTDAILFFDQSRFEAREIRNGSIYPDFPISSFDNTQGRITIAGVSSVSSPFTGSGIFATVDFLVLPDAASGSSQIKFDFDPQDKSKSTDSNVAERVTIADVLNQVNNGTFVIGSGSGSGCDGGGGSTLSPTPTSFPRGGVDTLTPTPFNGKLNDTGVIEPTMAILVGGGLLTLLGILGLVLL